MAMAGFRGATTLSALHVPPTGMYPQHYFQPLEQWLTNFSLDLGDGTTFRPYNPNASIQIADEARKTLGNIVPSNPNDVKRFLGAGWYQYNTQAAEKLMIKGGMRRNPSTRMWEFANGQPFRMELLCHTEGEEPGLNRMAAMIVENWRDFGVNVNLNVATSAARSSLTLSGEFDSILFWNIESWGGHPDLSTFLTPFHSSEYRPIGDPNPGRNWSRWRNPRVDRNINELLTLTMEDPRVLELGKEYIQLSVEEMWQIPISSYNVNAIMDEQYWTGYPDINNPYANPVSNWTNFRYIYVKLRPTGKN
jgi:peptide/nickel transport system substrate-binding protein